MRLKSGVIMKGQILQPYTQNQLNMLIHFQSVHTCDKFRRGIREVFLSFPEVFEKCIEYIRIFFIHFREISKFGKAGRE